MKINKYKKYLEDDFDLANFHKEAQQHANNKRMNIQNRKIIKVSTFFIIIAAFIIAYILYVALDNLVFSLFQMNALFF